MLKKICFSCQINLTIGERPNKKDIESLNLTRKVNILSLLKCSFFSIVSDCLLIIALVFMDVPN